MKKLLTSIIALLTLFVSSMSFATFHCAVEIKRVLVYGQGEVNVLHSGRNDFTYICDLQGDWKGIDTVTCAMWTSMLQNLQVNNRKAIFYYNGEGTCASLPTYGSTPAPVYIGSTEY